MTTRGTTGPVMNRVTPGHAVARPRLNPIPGKGVAHPTAAFASARAMAAPARVPALFAPAGARVPAAFAPVRVNVALASAGARGTASRASVRETALPYSTRVITTLTTPGGAV
ncbi:hypothetical protein K1Y80_23680 [Streptomyces sp. MAG02]|nr:hypothetical protein [Streptomyces sp. MAG02]